MNTRRRDASRRIAEKVILGAIQDIRTPDVARYIKTSQDEVKDIMNLIEEARITIKWGQ